MSRFALVTLVGWVVLALSADLLASDLPIAVRVDGETYWFPAFARPAALRSETQQSLSARAEWQFGTLVSFGPLQTVSTTGSSFEGAPPWPPSKRHWLGTDDVGRDVLARLIHGARASLLIALGIAIFATALGAALGAVAGWKGGLIDAAVSRLLELSITFPTLFFLITVGAVLRGPSIAVAAVVLVFTLWPEAARLMRTQVLRLKSRDFVTASRALGASELRIIWRHILPNALGPIVVSATSLVGIAVLLESSLSFLGLGVAPPTPSWGELLQQAHRSLVTPGAWWLAVFPGLAVVSLVLATQAVGRELERRFDARR